MRPTPSTTPAERRRAVLTLWLANIAIGTGLGANWLVHVPRGDEWRLLAFALPALLSTLVSLTALPGVAFVVAAPLVRSTRLLGLAQSALWTVFQVLLFADTRIYNAFGYHFNGQVWNLMYTRGSEDAVHLGWHVWATIAAGLVGVGAAQAWIWRRSLALALRPARRTWLRPSLVWSFVLLPAVFVEKTIYAQADLSRDRQITALAKLFPLYARVPMEDLASKVFGVEVERPPRVELEGYALDYPLERPRLDPHGARPSVLVVVVDCLRRDMLTPETMPRVTRWAGQDVRRFDDHVSGGNSTRYGIFSMLYGLYGSYWFPVLAEERGPVLLDVLRDEGYDFGVFSSATMNYPELRSTAWSAIPGSVHDAFPGEEPWQRDEQAARACADWLAGRPRGRPFFGFLLLDSPHQTYSHPPDARPFAPSADEVDYLAMTRNEPDPARIEAVRNRYKNAVRHADGVAAGVLEALDAGGLGADTIVFVTGDHGEEFRECGFFGHTSAYTREQIAVPLIVRGPGFAPGHETRPTSHLDLAPTLLELMGADPAARARWTLGASLLDPPEGRRRVISGWNELGVWTPEGIVRVPLGLLEFDLEVYDYRWQLVPDDVALLDAERGTLEALGADCNRFLLKPPTR